MIFMILVEICVHTQAHTLREMGSEKEALGGGVCRVLASLFLDLNADFLFMK